MYLQQNHFKCDGRIVQVYNSPGVNIIKAVFM